MVHVTFRFNRVQFGWPGLSPMAGAGSMSLHFCILCEVIRECGKVLYSAGCSEMHRYP